MDGNPADEARPDWRAAVSEDSRSGHRFQMVRAIYENSDSNTLMLVAADAAKVAEEEIFNAATSVLDYETRVGDFQRYRAVLMQAPAENSTPQIRYLGPQDAVSSSSNADPAAPVNSNPQAGKLDPEQQCPDGVRTNVDPSSVPVDLTLRMGPSEQQMTLRTGPSEQQNLSGSQSDSDCNTAPVNLTLQMGLSEQSHLSGRQCDSDRNNVPSSMPIPRQQAPQQRHSMPIPRQQASWPQLSPIPRQTPRRRLSMPIPRQQASRPRLSMPIPQQQAPPQPRLSIPIPRQQASRPRLSVPIPRPQVPQQQPQLPHYAVDYIPQPQAQVPQQQPQLPQYAVDYIPQPQAQVPQQQPQLPQYAVYLPQPQPQWQTLNLVFAPQPRWPSVQLGQLGVHAQSPLLGMSPRQRQQWWGMILPRRELPPQWLDMLPQEMLPAGYVWYITYPIDIWEHQWLALALLPQQLWPQLSNMLPSDPWLLPLYVILNFPPEELQRQQQLGFLAPPQQPPQQQQPGRGGHQADAS